MIEKLILGTVQFGLPYGINNQTGMPSPGEVKAILDLAYSSGLRCLDTAEGYGSSQSVLGTYLSQNPDKHFQILTKFSDSTDGLEKTLTLLHVSKVYGYSFHRFEDLKKSETWDTLNQLKASGKILKVGVSVYDNEEIIQASNSAGIDFIQIPFNVLDNANLRSKAIEYAKSHNKEIHVRSVFLQGLIYKDPTTLRSSLSPLAPALKKLSEIAAQTSFNMTELALNYALHYPGVDRVLIGVETMAQLKTNLDSIRKTLAYSTIQEIAQIKVDPSLIDPRKWHKN